MKRIFSVFLVLAGVSLVILVREGRDRGSSDLATSLSQPAQSDLRDTVKTSSSATRRAEPAAEAGPTDSEKLRILDDILASRNDNDPRMDHELRLFGPPQDCPDRKISADPARETERSRHGRLSRGPEPDSRAGLRFSSGVLGEPACLSLADCEKSVSKGAGAEDASASAAAVTLAYPQWVALRSLEAYLSQPGAEPAAARPAFEGAALEALRAALKSPNGAIAERAAALLNRFRAQGG